MTGSPFFHRPPHTGLNIHIIHIADNGQGIENRKHSIQTIDRKSLRLHMPVSVHCSLCREQWTDTSQRHTLHPTTAPRVTVISEMKHGGDTWISGHQTERRVRLNLSTVTNTRRWIPTNGITTGI